MKKHLNIAAPGIETEVITVLGMTFTVAEDIDNEVITFLNSKGEIVGRVASCFMTGNSDISLIENGEEIASTSIPGFEDFLEPVEAYEIFAKEIISMVNKRIDALRAMVV